MPHIVYIEMIMIDRHDRAHLLSLERGRCKQGKPESEKERER